ncbi:COG4 transport protein-domain-containing protein [Chytriomyces sp. MP71]|nr:COG4 transport protein-domain-containing protein [Chytriomyces sp. MP71]
MADITRVKEELLAATAEAVAIDAQLGRVCESETNADGARLAAVDTDIRGSVKALAEHTVAMHALIEDTAATAQRISLRVRMLDRDQQRVRRSLALIDSLYELKDSAAAVSTAIASQDWELAAIHIQRFLSLDAKRIRRVLDLYRESVAPRTRAPLSIVTQGSTESPLDSHHFDHQDSDIFWPQGSPDPLLTLQEARISLVATITQEFDSASDEATILRFFKLFSVVGEKSVGLDRFSGVLCGVVRRLSQDYMRAVSESDRVPTLFADVLTRMFESVASLIDKQEVTVERYYGAGRLLRIIVKLQKEVDVQAKLILESFVERRSIARKIADINALEIAVSQNRPAPTASSQLDAREIDALINEIAIISQRTRLFVRFLEVRSKEEEDKLVSLKEAGELVSPTGQQSYPTVSRIKSVLNVQEGSWRPAELDGIAFNKSSILTVRVKEIMSNFATLQEFFLKKSIEKAIKLDEYEQGAQTSSAVDDVFYIVKTSLARTLSTTDPITVCTVLESVGRILETEYVSVFVKRCSNNIGTLETKEGKVGVLVALNNLDTSCDYIQKLVKEIDAEIDRSFAGSSPAELEQMKTCLASLTNYGYSFKKSLMTWVENIFNQMIKPRIRQTVADLCKDTKYVLSDEEYVEADSQDLFIKRFVRDFGKLISVYKNTYSPRNHNQNVAYFIETILKEWERHSFSVKFNALGALRFDKDLRGVTSYLTGLTQWSMRDKFVRLNNASALLNVEGLGEVAEVMDVSAGWRLSVADVKKVLALRVDFNSTDISQLKL